jgi:prepilin-type N-terminal cleavage/methylation domain-containing protein
METGKKNGFTLVETLVAVAVLGLVAAGSIRLAALSARALGEVRQGRERLAISRNLWLRAVSGKLESRGQEKNVSWETGRFVFPGQDGLPPGCSCGRVDVVTAAGKGGEKMVLYIPDRMIPRGKNQ